MTHYFRACRLVAMALLVALGAFSFADAQTSDPFIFQITSSARSSFVGGISGDGRLIVIESNGDIATENPNNSDGNREIFLYDYAQRRIFQITNTTSARNDTTEPALDPDNPTDLSNIKVEVSNNRPVISHDGRWIVFTSNTSTPGSFDGDANAAALEADGNQEVFLYEIPAVPPVDLTQGTDPPLVNLATGSFIRVTNTPASRLPTPGTATTSPFVADDNREVAVNDDASLIAFISTRNFTGANGEENPNPEVFIYNRTTNVFAQITNTQGIFIFNQNPSLSGSGSVLAFISNANIPSNGGAGNNSDGNAEIYLANINVGATSLINIRQITSTTAARPGDTVNLLSPGRRLSRNGNLLAFESTATFSGAENEDTLGLFVYNVTTNTFTQVALRATPPFSDLLRFPTFTGDDSTLIFTSALNFRADGTAPATVDEGLNPNNRPEIFAVPVANLTSFTRLTEFPDVFVGTSALQPMPSDTGRRITFSMGGAELGGGNTDGSVEAFYLLTPQSPPASDMEITVDYFTGASEMPVVGPTPDPTPPEVAGLAAGMLGIARSTTTLAPSNANAMSASERRSPPLPVELNGVSVSIRGAAAGLYFVGDSPNEIRFVVPPGLPANMGTETYEVVINNNGNLLRSSLHMEPAQPDIFTDTNGPNGRAIVLNVTNPLAPTMEPFTVTSPDQNGEIVATVLQILLTGVRNVEESQVSVRIGDVDISGDAIVFVGPSDTPGFDQIHVTLPESLAGAGDVPVIVSVTISGVTFRSRPEDTAPRILIN